MIKKKVTCQCIIADGTAGGSKTKAFALASNGEKIGEAVFGPLNLNGENLETVEKTVHDGVRWMAQLPGGLEGCRGLAAGMAGVSNRQAVQMVEAAIHTSGYAGSFRLLGDHEIALEGAIEGPGAILIAGTGAVCYGRDREGNIYRTGGYGYLIDDGGSGYALGRDILMAVVRAFDGRGPATCLTGLVYQALDVEDISGLITWLYSSETGKKEIAGLAPLLLCALDEKDEAAKAIVDKAVYDLTDLVVTFWRRVNMTSGELALCGSIFQYYATIRDRLTLWLREVLPSVTAIELRHSAAQGAAMLAMKLFR